MRISQISKACLISLSLLTVGALLSCRSDEELPEVGTNIAGVVGMVTSPTGKYVYVLNSDYERRYDKGSMLLVEPEAAPGAQRVRSFETPRMGRSLTISQNLLVATYGDSEARDQGKLEIFDLSNELEPRLVVSQDLPCLPLNAIVAPSQPYIAVSCVNGLLFMGKNPKNDAAAPFTLDQVRNYGTARNALYFYEGAKTFLLAFPTDLNDLNNSDATLRDVVGYDVATDAMVEGANGVPDNFEDSATARRRWQQASIYQVAVYPVTDEETASAQPQPEGTGPYQTFRFIDIGAYTKPNLANSELHYISFILREINGQPTPSSQITDPQAKRYQTNFWEAKIGPEANPAIFYMSQRANYGSDSNNVIRFVINEANLEAKQSFGNMLSATRVYGFLGDRDNANRYPGDFEFTTAGGRPMLLVNHFRDLIYFAGAPFYSVTRKYLTGAEATTAKPDSRDTTDYNLSYYQLAALPNGKVMTASFYGNALYVFNVAPESSMIEQTPVQIQ